MALRLLEENIVAENALKRWDMLQAHVAEIRNGLLVEPGEEEVNDLAESLQLPLQSQSELLAAERAANFGADLEDQDGNSEIQKDRDAAAVYGGVREDGESERGHGQEEGSGGQAEVRRQGEICAELSIDSLAASSITDRLKASTGEFISRHLAFSSPPTCIFPLRSPASLSQPSCW